MAVPHPRPLAVEPVEDRLLPSGFGPPPGHGHDDPPRMAHLGRPEFDPAPPDRLERVRPQRVMEERARPAADEFHGVFVGESPAPTRTAALRVVHEVVIEIPAPVEPAAEPVRVVMVPRAVSAAPREATLSARAQAALGIAPPVAADEPPASAPVVSPGVVPASFAAVLNAVAAATATAGVPAVAIIGGAPAADAAPDPRTPADPDAPTVPPSADPPPAPSAVPLSNPAAELPLGGPLAGLLPAELGDFDAAVRDLISRLAGADPVDLAEGDGDDYFWWTAAAAGLAAGAAYAVRPRRPRGRADRVVTGSDSVLARWEQNHDGHPAP